MVYPTSYNQNLDFLSRNALPAILFSTACLVTLSGYFYLQNIYSFWSRKGVKGPRPLPFIGNFLDYIIKNRFELEADWVKKFGKVYGTYKGLRPCLVIADPEVLQQICIKDFEAFPNHELPEFSSKYAHLSLIMLKDEQWKRTRALTSPTFTSSRMKRMYKLMDRSADDLIECFAEQFMNEKSPTTLKDKATVNVKDIYNLFTMDTISSCCFGLKLERSGSSNLKAAAARNEFVDKAMKMFYLSFVRTIIGCNFSKKFLDKFDFKVTPDSTIEPLAEVVRRIIEQRRNSTKKFDDYLQSVIDARLSDELELNDMDSEESHHVGLTNESMMANQQNMIDGIGKEEAKKTKLTDLEILGGAIFILAVGLETTGSLLTHCTYALAFYPEVQEKLYEEMMKIAIDNDDDNDEGKQEKEKKKKYRFEYEAITACKYLDAVISETLRRITPVTMLDRISSRDYYLEKYNIHIPKGTELLLSYHAIQNDSDFWREPDRFDPERFMPGNREKIKPGSYCPFGLGPRHCIGMRFALTEAKLALAKMIVNYKFEPAPGKSFPPELALMLDVVNLKDPLVTILHRV